MVLWNLHFRKQLLCDGVRDVRL